MAKKRRGGSCVPSLRALRCYAVMFGLCLGLPSSAASPCKRKPIIFNFGDSNSDTGGSSAGLGIDVALPDGRTLFHEATGRPCDGRLTIDFLCHANLVGKDGFANFLYTIDIGQNDLAAQFTTLPYLQVVGNILIFIEEIRFTIWSIYQNGGKNFWVHNTGPLGCLPSILVTTAHDASDIDKLGCLRSRNDAAREFNRRLQALGEELRSQMKNATIVYVDVFTIKYDLIANYTIHGFENPLMACYSNGTVCEESPCELGWHPLH